MNTFYDEIAIIQPSRASVMMAGVNKQVFFCNSYYFITGCVKMVMNSL